ncbi:MAG: Flp pilus assembly protein CpaB [Planctomycetes bacterium]|nr:Flp pilus assembly protein CpaB [Planctomycetota bacterium]
MKQKNVILMVVAVGCGLVAAFLTAQMSGKQVEQVEVLVATKDLPVGTVFTKDEVKNLVKTKRLPKDGLPPAFVVNPDDLMEKRLSRPIRAEETINPADLNKGIALPDGHDLVALSIGSSQAASGFVVPGCRVDVMASLRLGNTLKVFDLLVNTLVINVNHDMSNNKNGVYPDINQVGFALTKKQAAALELARARGCNLTLKLRNQNRPPDEDTKYNIDEVIKLLEDEKNPTVVKVNGEEKKPDPQPEVKQPEVKQPEPKGVPDAAPAPTIKMANVLVAKRFIEPNTPLTNDLIKEAFEWKEIPKESATDAVTDFGDVVGNKAFKTGVAKGQWITYEMIGVPNPKPAPQEPFIPSKPSPTETTPVKPVAPPVVKRKIVDVAVHTASGTVIHRFEEQPSGQLKKIAELTPEQAAQSDKTEAPKATPDDAPKASPDARRD